jgi:hypothetical protein
MSHYEVTVAIIVIILEHLSTEIRITFKKIRLENFVDLVLKKTKNFD